MTSEIQIKILDDIVKAAARGIQNIIASHDLDRNTARALSTIAGHLQCAAFEAQMFVRSNSEVQSSVHASEPERSHVGSIL